MKEEKLIGIYGVRIIEQNAMRFVKALKTEAEKNGYRLLAFSAGSDDVEETDEIIGQYQLVELLRYVDIGGLVILTETIKNEKTIQKLLDIAQEKNIPIFSLDGEVEGCYNLLYDYENGFEQIVRHVVEEHQCRRVNMIAGFEGNHFSQDRIDVYKKVLQENGIAFEEERLGYGNFWERPTEEVMKRFLESDLPLPEAIICANDSMALTAISVLNEHGIEVPEDVIVTGYDGTRNGECFFPSLTTSRPEYGETVQYIFREVVKCTENKIIKPYDMKIPVILQKRQSCGCEQKMMQNNNRTISRLFAELGDVKWHTIAMHRLIYDTFGKRQIADISELLPNYVRMWSDHYRYVCVKAELLYNHEVPENYTEMVSMVEVNKGEFKEHGKKWNINEFHSYIQEVLSEDNVKTIVIRQLNTDKDVYGINIEGFDELDDWKVHRCDEFAVFLSQAIHAVLHNFKMNELNQNLYKVNKEIEELSLRDSMTGLYNRRGFFQKMRQMLQRKENIGKYLYVFFVDMDGLKYINDTFGHVEGDFAIITLAKSMEKAGMGDGICGRLGGDEFICASVEESDMHYSAEEFQKQLEEYLQNAEGVAEKPYPLSASVGMIFEEISDNLDLDAVINRADDKMYEHKMARKKQRT